MNKRNILIFVVVLLMIILTFCIIKRTPEQIENDNMSTKLKAVVVKVNTNSLLVMGIEKLADLYSVGFTDEGNIGYKQGQEILIYFDGIIMTSYPAQIGNIGKIEIIKEKSDVEIPKSILRFCYNSKENVKAEVNELTNKGITFTVIDKNELSYEYSNSYSIFKKVKNENYTGIGQKIGEDTENSTAGFTRNRYGIYMARGRNK